MTGAVSRQKRAAFLALFVNFLVFGAITTIIGATLPMVIQSLRWNDLEAGVVIAAHSVGYFSATFCSGVLVARLGFPRLISLGLLLQAIGVSCFGAQAAVAWNVAAFLLVGVGQGATELVTNYCVVQMEAAGSSRLMNLMHSAFTVGAILAPVFTAWFAGRLLDWRVTYVLLGALSVGLAAFFLGPVLRFLQPAETSVLSRRNVLEAVRHRFLLLLTFILFLYVGVEMGISAWIAVYFVRVFAVPEAGAAYLVSLYWAGILIGRIGLSLFWQRSEKTLLLLLFSAFSTCCLVGAMVSNVAWAAALCFFGAGLGYSVIYPLVMSVVGAAYPQQRGVAIGLAAAGGGIGMCLFPLAMSGLAERFNIETGFWFYVAVSGAMCALTGWSFAARRTVQGTSGESMN